MGNRGSLLLLLTMGEAGQNFLLLIGDAGGCCNTANRRPPPPCRLFFFPFFLSRNAKKGAILPQIRFEILFLVTIIVFSLMFWIHPWLERRVRICCCGCSTLNRIRCFWDVVSRFCCWYRT
jgi:hypothetical protein